MLFLLSFSKFTNSSSCKSARYLRRRPVRTRVGRETSRTRAIWGQYAYVLPTVPLMRASFPDVIYLDAVLLVIDLAAQRRLPEQTHRSRIEGIVSLRPVQNGRGSRRYIH